MASVPDEMPHPHAPTPTPPPPPPPPPPVPELPPYAPIDPQKTPLRPDLGSPPPYASVVQETYTNNGYQGEGRCQGQCQGQSQGQGQSQSQPQGRVHYHRGPPFHRCHVHHHPHRGPSGAGLSEAMQELVVDHGLSTSFGQYNQCSLNGLAAPMRYPQHVTIIRDSQVGADINTHCLIGFATFVLCCCCVPFGMAAMMKALEVRTRLRTGDIVGARTAASSSRMWAGSGLLIGAVFELSLIVYILYI